MTRAFVVAVAWLAAVAGAGALVFAASAGTTLTGSGLSPAFAGLGLAVIADASVGAVLTLRRPGNVVGLILLVTANLIPVTFLAFVGGAVLAEARGRHDVLAGMCALIGSLAIFPTMIVAGPLLALVFPNGRLPGPRWRWAVGAITLAVAVGSAVGALRPGPIGASFADNPLGVTGFSGSEQFWDLGYSLGAIALLFALLLAVAAVIVRVRRSAGVELAQLKWFVAANAIVAALLTLSLADGGTSPTVFDSLAPWSLSLPPIAVGTAILRYRLFEIDRLISRTISWALITGVLVTVFSGAVIAIQAALTGVTQGRTFAVAGSTLVAFALFQPLRRRVQAVVDRRFNRSRYDAQLAVEGFATNLRDDFDLERVGRELDAVVGRALAPTSVGVWLRPSVRVQTP